MDDKKNKVVVIALFVSLMVAILKSHLFKIPSLGLSLVSGVFFVGLLSFGASAGMYFFRKFNPFEKHGLLFLVRSMHYFTLFNMIAYIFIYAPESDWVYLFFVAVVTMHWIFIENECILTYWESKLLDPSYRMGDDPYKHVFIKLIIGENITWPMIILTLFMFFNSGVVIWRLDMLPYVVKIILVLMLAVHQINNNFERLRSK